MTCEDPGDPCVTNACEPTTGQCVTAQVCSCSPAGVLPCGAPVTWSTADPGATGVMSSYGCAPTDGAGPERSMGGSVKTCPGWIRFGSSGTVMLDASPLLEQADTYDDIADRPRQEWQYNGREIHMVTEPLRAREVMAAAREPWQGMPAGTQMGHLHLFVGDLEAATDFYHRALGLDRVVWSYPGALFLSAGGYHHHLGTNIWASGAAPAGPDDARLLEWSLLLPDTAAVKAAGESLSSAGYTVRGEDGSWTADDPWGTTLRVQTAASER